MVASLLLVQFRQKLFIVSGLIALKECYQEIAIYMRNFLIKSQW